MSNAVLLYLGVAALLGAVAAIVALIWAIGNTVPLARRRPPGAHAPGLVNRAAEAATVAAGRLLGSRAVELEETLDQAGIRARPQEVLVLVASGMVALFATGLLLWGPVAAVLALGAGPLIAKGVLSVLTARRRQAFALQLDETLGVLSGSLRAGYSLPQACSTVAAEAEAPTSAEFSRVINEARVGRTFIDAMESAAQRMRNEDFFWIVQAIAINREVGGNLADVLEGVSNTIRERTHLKRQVKSLAAEGKLSAGILGALPIGVFLLLSIINPAYVARFGDSIVGILLLVAAGMLLVIGLLWLRVLVRIKF